MPPASKRPKIPPLLLALTLDDVAIFSVLSSRNQAVAYTTCYDLRTLEVYCDCYHINVTIGYVMDESGMKLSATDWPMLCSHIKQVVLFIQEIRDAQECD